MIDIPLSGAPVNLSLHDISFFQGAFDPLPSHEMSGLTARRIAEIVAPEDGPRIVAEKDRAPYFVPTLLKVAPYVGRTAERFPGQSGKQRSAAHVVGSSWFAADLDDLPADLWSRLKGKLEAVGPIYCAFSTWSHGCDVGLMRVRVLLFSDRSLSPADWGRAWHVLNSKIFDGLADTATAKLSQQAGVWAAHPARSDASFRITGGAKLLSAEGLLALAPAPAPRPISPRAPVPKGVEIEHLTEALAIVGAESYRSWLLGLGALKGAAVLGLISDADGEALFVTWSGSAGGQATKLNADRRYDPASVWARWTPSTAPAEALVGALYRAARDEALRAADSQMITGGALDDAGLGAARFLARWHRATFAALRGVAA